MAKSEKKSLPPVPAPPVQKSTVPGPPRIWKLCAHPRQGVVTNQPGSYDETRFHVWRVCCDDPDCIKLAAEWVKIITKEPATFRRD